MKIVFNTQYDSTVARVVRENICLRYKHRGHSVVENDWNHYERYDLILFLAPDSQVAKAKKANPSALVGIMDPKLKTKQTRREAKRADFLVVSSLEQADAFLRINKNIVIHHWFSRVKARKKKHERRDTIFIGYHGNKIHLNAFCCALQPALEKLSKHYAVVLYAVYNKKKLGKWRIGVPRGIKVKHVQWAKEDYCAHLSRCDIGLMPNVLPMNKRLALFCSRIPFAKRLFNYERDDYLLRFKYTSNPNRIYEFSQLGLPVVADMFPSSAQCIQHGVSGFLVHSKEGWYDALERLIKSPALRQKMADNLRKRMDKAFSPEQQFKRFDTFLSGLKKRLRNEN